MTWSRRYDIIALLSFREMSSLYLIGLNTRLPLRLPSGADFLSAVRQSLPTAVLFSSKNPYINSYSGLRPRKIPFFAVEHLIVEHTKPLILPIADVN